MLATQTAINRFPGTVPALLAWSDGDGNRVAESVTSFCATAPRLARSLAQSLRAGNAQGVSRAAHDLHVILEHFGVPQIVTIAATIEDYGRARDLAATASLIDELEALLTRFCTYLATTPWMRH